jgi:hypothetical protein
MAHRKKHTTHPPTHADLEEVRPQHFVIHNMDTYPILKGSGVFKGKMFDLTTWRREGLIARLRQSGFVVRTFDDQVHNLPELPPATMIGEPVEYPRHSNMERYSHFDPQMLTWVADEPHDSHEGTPQQYITLHVGWVVRQRQGRGKATYYQVGRSRAGHTALAPLSETSALLAGYAQAAITRRTPLKIHLNNQFGYIPTIELPPPHRDIIKRLAMPTEQGWQVERQHMPLASRVYQALGIRLSPGKRPKKAPSQRTTEEPE